MRLQILLMAFKVPNQVFYAVAILLSLSVQTSSSPSPYVRIENDVSSDDYTISFKTPNLRLPADDIFICMSADVPSNLGTSYIVDINAQPIKGITTHMNINTCIMAGFRDPRGRPSVWDCGDELENKRFGGLSRAGTCADPDFPEGFFEYQFQGGSSEDGRLRLPPGTGIPVGGRTGINTIVLSMHYPSLNKTLDGFTGESLVDVRLAREAKDIKPASSLVLSAFGFLAPQSVSRISGSWQLDQDVSVHPIIIYVHSHGMVFNVNVLIERENGTRQLIHSGDPRLFKGMTHLEPEPQALRFGDKVQYECDFNSTSPDVIRVWNEEMCNIYLFYYTDKGSPLLDILVSHSLDPRDKNCFPPLREVEMKGINTPALYNGNNSFHPTTEEDCRLPI